MKNKTLNQKKKELAKELWQLTMAGIEYGDSRDNLKWQDKIKKAFIGRTTYALNSIENAVRKEEKERIIEELKRYKRQMSCDNIGIAYLMSYLKEKVNNQLKL